MMQIPLRFPCVLRGLCVYKHVAHGSSFLPQTQSAQSGTQRKTLMQIYKLTLLPPTPKTFLLKMHAYET